MSEKGTDLFTAPKDGKRVVVELSEPPGARMFPCHGQFVRRPGTSKESSWWVQEEDIIPLGMGSEESAATTATEEVSEETDEAPKGPPPVTPPKAPRGTRKKRTSRPKTDAQVRARNAYQLADRFRGPRTPRWRG